MNRSTQISLFDSNNNRLEIKKHSSLTQISSNASAVGRKLMNVLILIAQDHLHRNPNQRVFETDVGVVKRLIGMNDGSNNALKRELKKFKRDEMEYNLFKKDKENERGIFSFLSEAKIKSLWTGKASILRFEFPFTIRQMVKDPNIYVWINLLLFRGVESKHSMALYEFVKDYIKIGRFHLKVPQFRKLMGIKDNQYKIFTMLEKRVLKVGIDELNEKTDLEIQYSLERKGRKVEAIKLRMKYKDSGKLAAFEKWVIKEKLLSFGLAEKLIERLLQKHSEDYLKTNISVVEERMKKTKIKNIQGYLMRAFQVDYRPIESEVEKQHKIETQQLEQEVKEAEIIKQKEKQLLQEFKDYKKKQVEEAISSLTGNMLEELKNQFLQKMNESVFLKKIYETKGFDYHWIQIKWFDFLATQILPLESIDFEIFRAKKEEKREYLGS